MSFVYIVMSSVIPGQPPDDHVMMYYNIREAIEYANSHALSNGTLYVAVFDPLNSAWPRPFMEFAP
jgi:hypothetical protein